MSGHRVYVPASFAVLHRLLLDSGLGPPPLLAHAVTAGLREAYPEGGEEEWEYAAMSAAARDSLGVLTDADPPRRVVLALDVRTARPDEVEGPTAVVVPDAVPLRVVAAVLVDGEDAADDVRAGREAYPAAEAGDERAEAVVERCLDRELGWWAVQELPELLRS